MPGGPTKRAVDVARQSVTGCAAGVNSNWVDGRGPIGELETLLIFARALGRQVRVKYED